MSCLGNDYDVLLGKNTKRTPNKTNATKTKINMDRFAKYKKIGQFCHFYLSRLLDLIIIQVMTTTHF